MKKKKEEAMTVHPIVGPIISLIAGILILIFPAILNFVVAIYLIIIGLLGIFGGF
jgi:cobalamin synthase